MRKRTACLLVLFAAVCALVVTAASAVGRTADDVSYTRQVLYGDERAAVGLTASVRYTYRNRMYWFTDHRPGLTETPDTKFTYANFGMTFPREPHYTGLLMNVTGMLSDSEYTDYLRKNAASQPQGLMAAMAQLYENTPAGEVGKTYVRYADWCEYYPLDGYLDTSLVGYGSPFFNCYEDSSGTTLMAQLSRTLNGYFRIPVLPDDLVLLLADRRASAMTMDAIDVSEPRIGEDWYDMGSVSVLADDTLYFTFSAYTARGALVDTSLIPGGYGLYAMDVKNGKLDSATLRTCMALDPAYEPVKLYADADGRLLLDTVCDRTRYVTVIDLASMTVLQQLPLFAATEDVYSWVEYHDGFILCVAENTELWVYARGDDGCYDLHIHVPIPEDVFLNNIDHYRSQVTFNGERIAFAAPLLSEEYGLVLPGYRLAVYDNTGLLYSGTYLSSLSIEGEVHGGERCQIDELTLSWK